jgi:hypothetical protein
MNLKSILWLLWTIAHSVISLFDLWACLISKLHCYLISSELLPKYRRVHPERLECLGVDSSEANNVMEVKQLLHWFSTIGIKYVALYDVEGVIRSISVYIILFWYLGIKFLFSSSVFNSRVSCFHISSSYNSFLLRNRNC